MNGLFFNLAAKLWPELKTMNEQRRLVSAGDVFVTLALAPLVAAGIVWLVLWTDFNLIRQQWLSFILFAALIFLFNKISYFLIVEIRTDRYGSADGSFNHMVLWSAVLLFGPTALWLSVILDFFTFVSNFRQISTTAGGWSRLRSFFLDLASLTIGFLAAIRVYERLGGQFPIAGLSLTAILPALGAIVVHFAVVILILSIYIAYAIWVQKALKQEISSESIIKFALMAAGFPFLSYPFGVLAAGLYVGYGLTIFLIFMTGLVFVAYLARQLSWAVESSRQQSRQLEKLEQLGRDIINSPPDASKLAGLLEKHVPTMFPPGQVAIWLEPDQFLYKSQPDWSLAVLPLWKWLVQQDQAQAFLAHEPLPGENRPGHDPVVIAPILDVDSSLPIGGIYLQLRSLSQPWDLRAVTSIFPAIHTLAAQVASALKQAENYANMLEYQQAAQELAFAGRIQASFLPNELPLLDGWEIAVTFLPARETSGDFFDFIPLSDDKIGILIADVADKGVGAALYMALSRTLIRTYALEYETQPDIAILASNERILQDARANLFITAFYGILDPTSGTLTYCNAGHNPPYLLSQANRGTVRALGATGMPLGIEPDAIWEQAVVQIEPGDVLLLYTDGIPDAQDSTGEFFREKRLVEMAQENLGLPAHELQNCVVKAVQTFEGEERQFDDITLLVLMRNPE